MRALEEVQTYNFGVGFWRGAYFNGIQETKTLRLTTCDVFGRKKSFIGLFCRPESHVGRERLTDEVQRFINNDRIPKRVIEHLDDTPLRTPNAAGLKGC